MVNSNLLKLFLLQYGWAVCIQFIYNIYGYVPFVLRGPIINNQIPRVINITVQILVSCRGESIDAESI